MDIFDRPYYRTIKRFMEVIGQWPYQSRMQRQIQCIIIYLLLGTFILGQALKLPQFWGNIEMMVECIVPMGVQVVAFMKATNCIFNDIKMKKLLDLMKKDWANLMDEVERKTLSTYAEKGFSLGKLYGASIFGSMVVYLILPIMPQILDVISPLNETRPRQFLYETEYFVNEDDYYTEIMIHDYIATLFTVLIIITVDSMLLAYVHHVCGILMIIGNRIENTMTDANSYTMINWTTEDENIHRHIANCIKDHAQALEFAELIEASYSVTFLFQMSVCMFIVSATGLQVVSHLGNYHEMFRLGQFVFGQLFHIFVNSWPSQMLIDHTQHFQDSLYFAEWYEFPLHVRHVLRLAMMRSLKPSQMTAGKLFVMSMESFAKVVKTSMSYFTVLASLR